MLVFCSILLAVGCLQEEKKESPLKHEYKSEEGGFKIRFQSKPETKTDRNYENEVQIAFTSKGKGLRNASVAFSYYPSGFIAMAGPKNVFLSIVYIDRPLDAEIKFKSRKPFEKGEMKGEDIELGGRLLGTRIRYFVAGDRFFMLSTHTEYFEEEQWKFGGFWRRVEDEDPDLFYKQILEKRDVFKEHKEISTAFFDSFELTQTSKEYAEKRRIARMKTVENLIESIPTKLELAKKRLAELKTKGPKERIWKSEEGKSSISATFVESKVYRIVTLKKKSGQLIPVERKLLCHEDLKYLAELKKSEKTRLKEISQQESFLKNGPDTLKRLREELKSLKEKK